MTPPVPRAFSGYRASRGAGVCVCAMLRVPSSVRRLLSHPGRTMYRRVWRCPRSDTAHVSALTVSLCRPCPCPSFDCWRLSCARRVYVLAR